MPSVGVLRGPVLASVPAAPPPAAPPPAALAATTGVRSYGAGRLSQAMPSLSLPSKPSGSDGSARRCACASAWESKSEQS
jgi:hypothetical protein